MHSTSFAGLQSNLTEIYAALCAQKKGDSLPLYATTQSTVYFEGSLAGKTLKIWDKLWRHLQGSETPSVEKVLSFILTTTFDYAVHDVHDSRQHRIVCTVQQINRKWQILDVTDQPRRYRKFLQQELRGSPEEESPLYSADFNQRRKTPFTATDERNHRHKIVDFQQAAFNFWELFTTKKEDQAKISEPLKHFLNPSSTLIDPVLLQALQREAEWVKMESILQKRTPVDLLSQLTQLEQLTVSENRRLNAWVQALNDNQHMLSPELLFSVLTQVIAIIHIQGSSSLTLQDLLYWLHQHDCQLLDQDDPLHMDWREGLARGDSLACNGIYLILGEQLGPDKLEDPHKIFELPDYPGCVVKVADKRHRLLIEARQAENDSDHWGVHFVKTIDLLLEDSEEVRSGLDQEGNCVVIERLPWALSQHKWTSKKIKLTKKDKEIAQLFANHVFWQVQWNTTVPLSPEYLFRNKEGVLTSTHLLKRGPPNYSEWEKQCITAAKGNEFVLSYLMHVSNLRKHPIGDYFQARVQSTLETGKIALIGHPLPLGHRHPYYEQQAKDLCERAQELRTVCLKQVTAQRRKKKQYFDHHDLQWQETLLIKRLVKFYLNSPTPGAFPSHLQENIVQSFTPSSPKKSPNFLSPRAQAYYQKQFEQMVAANQTLQDEEQDV